MKLSAAEQNRLQQAAEPLKLADRSRSLLRYVEDAIETLRRGENHTPGIDAKPALVQIQRAARKLSDVMKQHLPQARQHLPVNAYSNELEGHLVGFIVELDFTIGCLSKPGPKLDRARWHFEVAVVFFLARLGVPLPKYVAAPWMTFLEEAYKVALQRPTGSPFSREAAIKRLAEYVDYATGLLRQDQSGELIPPTWVARTTL